MSSSTDSSMRLAIGRVRPLPPRSAVLYGMLAVDAAGVPYEQERALAGLREVANARVHATTGEVPAARLEEERGKLDRIPPPYGGLLPRHASAAPSLPPPPIAGLQHPLALYDALFITPPGPMAPEAPR